MITIDILTFGCKVNQAESGSLQRFLESRGLTVSHCLSGHEWVIINSCAVTAVAAATVRKQIRRVHRLNTTARIIVCGCLGALEARELQELDGVAAVFGPGCWQKVAVYLLKNLGQEVELPDSIIAVAGYRTRPEVKIQDGCDGKCAYCTIPKARGASRSAPPAEIAATIEQIDQQGYREIFLSGIHLGRYGLDLTPPGDLASLLEELIPKTCNARFRLGSLEANEITSKLLNVLAKYRERICPHFHIPLQSATDEILSLMNRPYNFAGYARLLEQLRKLFPEATLGTDIIIGHPGESEGLFKKTLNNIKNLPLDYYHIFPFSARPDTPAAKLPGVPAAAMVKERLKRMQEYDHSCRKALHERQIGRTLQVILEQEDNGFLTGTSENYLEVKTAKNGLLAPCCNKVIPLKITAVNEGKTFSLRGEP